MPARVAGLEADNARWAERASARAGLKMPAEDPDYEPECEAFPAGRPAFQGAILQPPAPELRPSPRVLEAQADREAGS